MQFKEWLCRQKIGAYSANRYSAVIYGIIPKLSDQMQCPADLTEIPSLEEVRQWVEYIKAHPLFQEKNNAGHRMYSAALNKFVLYREAVDRSIPTEVSDISEIEKSEDLLETEKLRLIKARVGQGDYRAKLVEMWNGCCSVTGYPDARLLIASHIKPWYVAKNRERLDPKNGLLLTPNLDKVFDGGFISFDPKNNGKIIFSPYIICPEGLGLSDSMSLRTLSSETAGYLQYHQEHVFIK